MGGISRYKLYMVSVAVKNLHGFLGVKQGMNIRLFWSRSHLLENRPMCFQEFSLD